MVREKDSATALLRMVMSNRLSTQWLLTSVRPERLTQVLGLAESLPYICGAWAPKWDLLHKWQIQETFGEVFAIRYPLPPPGRLFSESVVEAVVSHSLSWVPF